MGRVRHIAVRRTAALVLALLLATLLVPDGGASASCAAPALTVAGAADQRPHVFAGQALTVEGRAFVEDCEDTRRQGFLGCSALTGEEPVPQRGVALLLRQGDREWRLGTTDAGQGGDAGDVSWSVSLPPGLRAGRATLVADTASLDIRVHR